MKPSRLVVPLVSALVIAATSLVPDRREREEARFVPLVAVDEAGLVVRPDGTKSQLTALSLVDARHGELLFARVRGRWRCVTYFMAPADAGRITQLVNAIVDEKALDATPARDVEAWIAQFGLDDASAEHVVLRGPDALKPEANGDVLAEVVIGSGGTVRRATGAGDARRVEDEVLRSSARLERFFEPPVTVDPNTLPPLVSARVVPEDWVGFQSGLEHVFVDRADGTGFELQRVVDPATPTGLTAWDLRESADEPWRRAHPVLSTGYTLFLGRTPVVRALDPRAVPRSVTDTPAARITLVSAAKDVVELLVGEVDAFGVRLVVNLDTQAAYELAPEPSRLVLPSVAMLEKPGAEIPWDPYLH